MRPWVNRFWAAMVLLLGVCWGYAQEPWANRLFIEGTTKDFGVLEKGSRATHAFRMTNIYRVPLEIISIRSTCGCVMAEPSRKTLLPYQTEYIHVTIDTRRYDNAKNYNVYVTFGPAPQYFSVATLHVRAQVR